VQGSRHQDRFPASKCGSHCMYSPVIGFEMRVFFVFPLPDSSLWGHLDSTMWSLAHFSLWRWRLDSTRPRHPHIV